MKARSPLLGIALACLGTLLLSSCATRLPDASVPVADGVYGSAEAWLCRPGRADLCGKPQELTLIAAGGARTTQVLRPRADAPVDCFYVYPTISEDPAGNSSMRAGPGEQRAVAQQFAPFASVCRPFAPMYRQITLAGLIGGPPVNREIPFEDVRAAWRHYLKHDNQGRGVVLVGHSQGSRMLMELLRQEIEGKPSQKLLVAAYLLGFNMTLPAGRDIPQPLTSIPMCRGSGQTGCIVGYVSFRASSPPPANTRFGRAASGGEIACVDPVRLSGHPLRAMLPVQSNLLGRTDERMKEWNALAADVRTPFVDFPGYLEVECTKRGSDSYLALTLDAAQRGRRPSDLPLDLVSSGRVIDFWGLHLADVNLVMGNLLELVRLQSAAYARR